MTVCGVLHDIFYFVLRIKAAVMCIIICNTRIAADNRTVTPGTDLSEPRILLDLDTPALVFGQMPVEVIHFMECDIIDIAFHKGYRHKMASDIKMQAPVGKAWVVL